MTRTYGTDENGRAYLDLSADDAEAREVLGIFGAGDDASEADTEPEPEDSDDDDDAEEEESENYSSVYVDGTQLTYGARLDYDDLLTCERVSVSFGDKENGYQSDAQARGALGWVNNANISLDRRDDAVTVSISVGDPRGAFAFTVRRLSDGRLVMYLPYPGEGMAHMPLRKLHEGTYQIGGE